MKLKELKVNTELQGAGVPVEIVPGIVATVRSTATTEYQNRRNRLLRQFSKYIAAGMAIPAEKTDEITATLMAEYLVTGWQGVTDDDDKPIPFSRDNAFKLFRDPAYRQFRDLVFEAASADETFRRVEVGNAAKN